MSPERNPVLLLSGSQHWDERRPITCNIRRFAEQVNPLGIAIVARYLKDTGIETTWREMRSGQIDGLESLVEKSSGVFISARIFDTDHASAVVSIANKHRKPVVVGGYAATFDSGNLAGATLVKGEFEPVGERVVEDYLSGKLGDVYDSRSLPPHDITCDYKRPNREIFPEVGVLQKIARIPQEWQRGCYNYCSFCSPVHMQGGGSLEKVRQRKASDIIGEIEEMGLGLGSHLFSTDLNSISIDRDTLLEVFGYLQKNGIKWYTEGTVLPLIEDLEKNGEEQSLLRLMSALKGPGGCYSFLYGADDLATEGKVTGSRDKEISLLKKAVPIFRRFGIPLNLSVVVGLDNHIFPDSLFAIRRMIEEVGAPHTFVHVATPYPGTAWGEVIKRNGRYIPNMKSTDFNHRRVVHDPGKMSAESLQQGYYWLLGAVSRPQSTIQIAGRNFSTDLFLRDPLLGLIGTGLPWQIETDVTLKEVWARGFVDAKVHKMLDFEYKEWLRKN